MIPLWEPSVGGALDARDYNNLENSLKGFLEGLGVEEWGKIYWGGILEGIPSIKGSVGEQTWEQEVLPVIGRAIIGAASTEALVITYASLEKQFKNFHEIIINSIQGKSYEQKTEWLKINRPEILNFYKKNIIGLRINLEEKTLLTENRYEEFRNLPKRSKLALLSPKTSKDLVKITEKNHISEEGFSHISALVGMVILREISANNLIENIQEKVGIDKRIAKTISDEINAKVLTPIFSDLKTQQPIPHTNQYTPEQQQTTHQAPIQDLVRMRPTETPQGDAISPTHQSPILDSPTPQTTPTTPRNTTDKDLPAPEPPILSPTTHPASPDKIEELGEQNKSRPQDGRDSSIFEPNQETNLEKIGTTPHTISPDKPNKLAPAPQQTPPPTPPAPSNSSKPASTPTPQKNKKEEPSAPAPFIIREQSEPEKAQAPKGNDILMRPYFFKSPSNDSKQEIEDEPISARVELGDKKEKRIKKKKRGRAGKENVRVVNYQTPEIKVDPFAPRSKTEGNKEIHQNNIVDLKDLPK